MSQQTLGAAGWAGDWGGILAVARARVILRGIIGILADGRDSRCRKGAWDSPWDSRYRKGLTTNGGLATIEDELGIDNELCIHDELEIHDDLEKIEEDSRGSQSSGQSNLKFQDIRSHQCRRALAYKLAYITLDCIGSL
jgi:hypothetical protein